MLDLKAISEMSIEEFLSYGSKLTNLSESEHKLLTYISGFMFGREVAKQNLTQEQESEVFYQSLLRNFSTSLENLYKIDIPERE